jgi:hypothetical protein
MMLDRVPLLAKNRLGSAREECRALVKRLPCAGRQAVLTIADGPKVDVAPGTACFP